MLALSLMLKLLLLCVALVVSLADIDVEDNVLVLTDDNFQEAIQKHSNLLVEFYAPWCGHCKQLAPEYAKAAKRLADSPVKLAKLDATAHTKVAQSFQVRGYPTLKYFKNGQPSEYSGGRTEDEIVSWLSKKTGPPAVTISTVEALETLKEQHEVFVLGVFDSVDSGVARAYVSAADGDERLFYAITSDADVKSALGIEGNAVVVIKTFDDKRADLAVTDEVTADDIKNFAAAESSPLIQTFSPENAKKIFSSPIQQHVLFITDKKDANHEEIVEVYRSTAAEYKGKLLFVNVPAHEDKILEFFNVQKSEIPATVLADLGSESGIKKYKYTGAHEKEAISAYVDSFLKGEAKPFLKSETVLESDTQGPVTILRGTSFEELVINNNKDVFVEFYAPWCGHCKKLEPTWDALGEKFASQSDKIIIAKMDATANEVDVPGLAVRGFPTIYFFKGNDKSNPVKYEGGRELDDLVDYIQEHGSPAIEHDEL